MKFQLSIPSWNFKPGWKSPHNQPLNIKTFVNEPAMVVIFEPDLPCFWIGPSVFWLSPSRVFFESDLLYFDSVFPFYWASPSPFWVSPSECSVSPSHFLSQSFPILKVRLFQWMLPNFWLWPIIFQWCQSVLPMLWVSPSHFFSLRTFCFSPFCVLIWSPCVLLTKLKMKVCAGSVYSTSMHKKLI